MIKTNRSKQGLDALAATNILLSRGGIINPAWGDLSFPVLDASGTVREKTVHSVHYTPGFISRTGFYLQFAAGYAPVEEQEDLDRLFSFILRTFRQPDRRELSEEELADRTELRRINQRFITAHGDLDERDFEMVARYRETVRKAHAFPDGRPVPLPGDIVEGAYYGGKHPFAKGCVDTPYAWQETSRKVVVCAEPYVPWIHVRAAAPGYGTSISGGPFFDFMPEDLILVGPATRNACDWGHGAACADGAVEFSIEVNRWRVKEGTDY